MTPANFDAKMKVGDALARHPHVRWVFAAYHVGGCSGCSRVDDETIEELAAGYELPLEKFLADLNALLGASH